VQLNEEKANRFHNIRRLRPAHRTRITWRAGMFTGTVGLNRSLADRLARGRAASIDRRFEVCDAIAVADSARGRMIVLTAQVHS
jgi:hypothetical protein